MSASLPDFLSEAREECLRLGSRGAARLLDAGRRWALADVLRDGGALLFPHTSLDVCGHQTAAAVHACLDSGRPRVLVLGVLHALTPELQEARVRVAEGGDVTVEPAWGVQGPKLGGRDDWRREFSLYGFRFLWEQEIERRGIEGPQLIVRYPYLAGGRPGELPGIAELCAIAAEAAVVGTADLFHHGIGYGDPPSEALAPEAGGLERARERRQGIATENPRSATTAAIRRASGELKDR